MIKYRDCNLIIWTSSRGRLWRNWRWIIHSKEEGEKRYKAKCKEIMSSCRDCDKNLIKVSTFLMFNFNIFWRQRETQSEKLLCDPSLIEAASSLAHVLDWRSDGREGASADEDECDLHEAMNNRESHAIHKQFYHDNSILLHIPHAPLTSDKS